MNNRSVQKIGLALISSALFFGFQNCTKVRATAAQVDPSAKVDGAGAPPAPEAGYPTPQEPEPTSTATPPTTTPPTTPASEMDPREIHCKDMTADAVPAIVYDSKTLTGSAPVNVSMMNLIFGKSTIDAENVRSISNFAGNIKVSAATVGDIENFAAINVEVNAKTVDTVSNFAAMQVEVVAHEIAEASNFAGDFCASAQKIGEIENLASRLSLYGRKEGDQKATLERLGNVAGFISIYNFEIKDTLSNAAIHAKLVNSHLPKLENAAGDIILVDSVIDEVAHFAGRIVLKGSSKVLKHDSSAIMIVNQ